MTESLSLTICELRPRLSSDNDWIGKYDFWIKNTLTKNTYKETKAKNELKTITSA